MLVSLYSLPLLSAMRYMLEIVGCNQLRGPSRRIRSLVLGSFGNACVLHHTYIYDQIGVNMSTLEVSRP